MGDKGDKKAARPPEGSLVETRCLIKGLKSAIVPFAEPRSGPKSRAGSGASQKAKSQVRAQKRIKTRRLTNIYHSDDDDVGDGYNLLSPLSLSRSLSLFPRQLSECAKIFERISRTLLLL